MITLRARSATNGAEVFPIADSGSCRVSAAASASETTNSLPAEEEVTPFSN